MIIPLLDKIAGYFLAAIFGSILVGASVWHYKDLQIEAAKEEAEAQIIKITQSQVAVSQQAAVKQIQVQHDIVTKYQTIREQIPIYVHENDPVGDPYLPSGFVILHNAAATNSALPDPASGANDPSGGAQASEFLGTVVTNYQTCAATAEELVGLQGWVKEISAQENKAQGNNK